MEATNIKQFYENNELTKECSLESVKVEIKEEILDYDLNESFGDTHSVKPEPGLLDNMFYVVNSVPMQNVSVPTNFTFIQYPQVQANSYFLPPKIPDSYLWNIYPQNSSVAVEFKPIHLSTKPKHVSMTDKIRLCVNENGNNDNNASSNPEHIQPAQDGNNGSGETSINNIPKDVLGDYGIVFDEFDYSAQANNADSDDDDEFNRRLVIDEDKDAQRVEEPSVSQLPEKKAPEPKKRNRRPRRPRAPSRRNSWGIDNAGHHLVISSVVSLQRKLCIKCDEVFPSGIALLEHQTRHCSFSGCPEIIEDEEERARHEQVHRDHPVKPFRCDVCRKRFHYYRFAQKHREICKLLKKSKCPYCKYATSKVRQFNKHVAKHLNTIPCTDCKKKYTVVNKFTNHMFAHHNKKVSFQCTECPRRFQMSENLINHITTHGLNINDIGIPRFIRIDNK